MKKFILTVAAGAICSLFGADTASAQVTERADGNSIQTYCRVQNVGTGKYVEVSGPFTTAPRLTLEESLTNAGTVMRLRAFPDGNGSVYKIGNLSCQGIEVFGAPQVNYYDKLMELSQNINFADYVSAAYSLQRAASEIGYIATGRMVVQALFQVVAERLDTEIGKLPAETKTKLGLTEEDLAKEHLLGDFAKRFNEQVSANIDLHAYLEPVDEAAGTYRLYFNWIDCTEVSKFYLANEQNKHEFEIGFECMRQYMNGKDGLGSGEYFDTNEIALWKSYGFDLEAYLTANPGIKYEYDDKISQYHITYDQIFANHELLYNWIKMYVERMLDPEKAPNATVLGINFKDFAAEMQRHAIMQGFLKYIPSMQENQKLYLASGRFSDGVNEFSTVGSVSDNAERFGLLAETQAKAAGDATIWKITPIKSNTDCHFAIEAVGHRLNKLNSADAHFVASYFDFPIEVLSDKMKIHGLGASEEMQAADKENLGHIQYVELGNADANTTVPRRTCVLIEVEDESATATDYIVEIPWQAQDSDYTPEVSDKKPDGFGVSDEEVDKQNAKRRAGIETGDSDADSAIDYHGVLLATQATQSALNNQLGIDADMSDKAVYDLTTRANKTSNEGANKGKTISTPWYVATDRIPANHAFVLAPRTDDNGNERTVGISLEAPEDEEPEIITGVESITTDPADMQPDVIYDLQGHRVTKVCRGGIYILNGKKILVK